jgi:hypothetical protein
MDVELEGDIELSLKSNESTIAQIAHVSLAFASHFFYDDRLEYMKFDANTWG